MALQEPAFYTPSGGARSWNNDKVFVTAISGSASKNRATRCRMMVPIPSNRLIEDFYEGIIERLLGSIVDIPKYFFNGRDCDMTRKLSGMLRDSILQQRHGVSIDHFYVFVYVSEDCCCWYNIVNAPCFSNGDYEQCPSIEFIRSLACESGAYSLPVGARAVKRLKLEDDHKEDDCTICLQGFSSNNEVAKLPCSHVFHPSCVFEWFVQNVRCPLCRSPCN